MTAVATPETDPVPAIDAPAATSTAPSPPEVPAPRRTTAAPGRLARLMAAGVRALLLAALVVVAAWPLGRLFVGGGRGAVAAAAVAGALLAWAGHARRLPLLVSLPLALVVGVVLTAALTGDDLLLGVVPTPSALADAVAGATGGWRDLLTLGLPVDVRPRLLAGPVALSFLAACAAVELAQRARATALALLPPVLVLGLALAVSASRGGPGPWLGVAVTVLALVALVQGAGAAGGVTVATRSSLQSLALGAGVGVVLAAVGLGVVLVAPLTDEAERFDLRRVVEQQVVVREDLSPLARLAGQQHPDADPDRPVFTVTFTDTGGLPGEALAFLPVAALDRYDGALWTTSARFVRPGSELPAPEGDIARAEVAATVELRDDDSAFLPLPRGATAVTGEGLGYDAATGTLAREPGADTDRYGFTAQVADPEALRDAATDAPEPGDDVDPALVAVPDLPPALTDVLDEVRERGSTPFTRLDLLADLVSDHGANPAARSGHTLARLAAYLGEGDDPFAHRIGTSEQAAAAFAAIARALGVPARVVVGYHVGAVEAGEPVTVTAGDIRAQAEVLLGDVGWVPFETRPTEPVALPDEDPTATVPDPHIAGAPEPPEDEPAIGAPAPPPAVGVDDGRSWLSVALVVLALLVAVVAGPPVAKWLRRRRRRRGPPARQIAGAAAEVRDRLVERHRPAGSARTVREWLDGPTEPLPEPARRAGERLGVLVDHALYDRRPPELPEAVRAWSLSDEFRRALAAEEGLATRLRCRLDPRPLLDGDDRG